MSCGNMFSSDDREDADKEEEKHKGGMKKKRK
jgi:hypothetical protein